MKPAFKRNAFKLLVLTLVVITAIFAFSSCGEKSCKHEYEDTVVSPTCTAEGYTLHTCKKCGENYTDSEVEKMLEEYDMRRKIIVSGFNKLGLECREPKGAFYAFPSIKSTGLTSEQFCERLLAEKRVAVVPGNAFGDSGEGFIRTSYCYSTAHIKEALKRIGEFLKTLK